MMTAEQEIAILVVERARAMKIAAHLGDEMVVLEVAGNALVLKDCVSKMLDDVFDAIGQINKRIKSLKELL